MRPSTAWALLAFGIAALFCWLAAATMSDSLAAFDEAVRAGMHALASPTLTALAQAVTWFGTLGVLALIGACAAMGFVRAKRYDRAVLLTLSMTGAVVLENALKFAFRRPRPPPFFGSEPHTYSFPSGHALFSLCFYGVLALLLVRDLRSRTAIVAAWTAATLWVATIGATRIYLGVHYPSDVLGGYLVAAAWISAVMAAEQRVCSR